VYFCFTQYFLITNLLLSTCLNLTYRQGGLDTYLMLYVIYGTDADVVRKKAGALRDALQKKKPDASLFSMTATDVSYERFEELTQSQGLFENKYIVICDHVLEDREKNDVVYDALPSIEKSPNIFIMLEGKLLAEAKKKLEKYAEKMEEHTLPEKTKKDSGEIFALADAFGRRDTKSLWALYRQAIDDDAVPEEIHGILWWQAKSIALARSGLSPAETGLNPFVHKKALVFAKNFSTEEIDGVLSRLVRMYHDAHRGKTNFEIALERFVLEV
jgi:DNA polymerase III delta subunit